MFIMRTFLFNGKKIRHQNLSKNLFYKNNSTIDNLDYSTRISRDVASFHQLINKNSFEFQISFQNGLYSYAIFN